MRPSRMWVRYAITVAVAGTVVAGCSSGAEQVNCTLIGAVSGVSFDFSQIAPRIGPVLLHACVRTKCRDETIDPDATTKILVTDDTLDGPGPVAVTLVIRSSAQKVIFNESAEVALKKTQPNGPKCPPTAWYESVSALQGGKLVAG